MSTPGSTQATRCLGVDLEDPVELRGHDHDAGRRSGSRRPRGRCRSPGRRTGGRARAATRTAAATSSAGLAGSTRRRRGPARCPRRVRRARARAARRARARGRARAARSARSAIVGHRWPQPTARIVAATRSTCRRRYGRRRSGAMPTRGRIVEMARAGARVGHVPRPEGGGSDAGRSTSRSSCRTGTCIFGDGCQGVLTERAPELVHGLLLVRRALLRHAATATTSCGRRKQAHRRRVAVRQGRPQEGHLREGRQGRRRRHWSGSTRIVDDACIFLNRPGSPPARVRAPPARDAHRRHHARPEARGVLAAAAAAPRRGAGRRHRHLDAHRVRARRAGARAARTSRGGAPRSPRRSSRRSRSTSRWPRAAQDARASASTGTSSTTSTPRRATRSVPPVAHPAAVPVQLTTKRKAER